jgi:hypothetical protein
MCAAVRNNRDWKLSNTKVVSCTNTTDVYLHGNLVARLGETWLELFDGGWRTPTTKSRLNALLQVFGLSGERVFQKRGEWFVVFNGTTIPFFSGMRLH